MSPVTSGVTLTADLAKPPSQALALAATVKKPPNSKNQNYTVDM